MCKKVTDRQLRQAVAQGASSFGEVSRETRCSTQCGKCTCLAREIVDDALLAQFGATHPAAQRFDELAYAVG
ncbi:(2Fe-2S)-binding protein [Kushneria aurantia]